MQFENSQQKGSYDSGYGASPQHSNDYEPTPFTFGQKIAQDTPESAHLREHRLNIRMGMAIISLVLWMVFFFISISIILQNPIIQPIMVTGLSVFTVLVILANILINRKKE